MNYSYYEKLLECEKLENGAIEWSNFKDDEQRKGKTVDLSYSNLRNLEFYNYNFDNVDMTYADIEGSKFYGASMSNVKYRKNLLLQLPLLFLFTFPYLITTYIYMYRLEKNLKSNIITIFLQFETMFYLLYLFITIASLRYIGLPVYSKFKDVRNSLLILFSVLFSSSTCSISIIWGVGNPILSTIFIIICSFIGMVLFALVYERDISSFTAIPFIFLLFSLSINCLSYDLFVNSLHIALNKNFFLLLAIANCTTFYFIYKKVYNSYEIILKEQAYNYQSSNKKNRISNELILKKEGIERLIKIKEELKFNEKEEGKTMELNAEIIELKNQVVQLDGAYEQQIVFEKSLDVLKISDRENVKIKNQQWLIFGALIVLFLLTLGFTGYLVYTLYQLAYVKTMSLAWYHFTLLTATLFFLISLIQFIVVRLREITSLNKNMQFNESLISYLKAYAIVEKNNDKVLAFTKETFESIIKKMNQKHFEIEKNETEKLDSFSIDKIIELIKQTKS